MKYSDLDQTFCLFRHTAATLIGDKLQTAKVVVNHLFIPEGVQRRYSPIGVSRNLFVAQKGCYLSLANSLDELVSSSSKKLALGETVTVPPNTWFELTSFYDEHNLVNCDAVIIETQCQFHPYTG